MVTQKLLICTFLLLKDLRKYSDDPNSQHVLDDAVNAMLVVLRCVNDSMHQISISAYPVS